MIRERPLFNTNSHCYSKFFHEKSIWIKIVAKFSYRKDNNFNKNQFFMSEFDIICQLFIGCRISVCFQSRIRGNSVFSVKSYNFDQNRIFVSEFNLTRVSDWKRLSQRYQNRIRWNCDFRTEKLHNLSKSISHC